tara:strand:+ start:16715 stop:17428 length:714 start_codon:yes stop_codon:yes gene_type:complete
LTGMHTMLLALLCCLLALSATTSTQASHPFDQRQIPPASITQDSIGQASVTEQDSLAEQLRQLIKTQRTGDQASQAKASLAIAKLRQTRFSACYHVYKQCQDDVLRALLGTELILPEIRAAHAILLAKGPRGEHLQGGVVDHHDLWLQFDQHEVLFADPTTKTDHLINDRFLLARGTHQDTWLCDLLRRDIEPHNAAQIWIFKRRLLMHANGQSGLTLHEFVRLPADAAIAVRELRK